MPLARRICGRECFAAALLAHYPDDVDDGGSVLSLPSFDSEEAGMVMVNGHDLGLENRGGILQQEWQR